MANDEDDPFPILDLPPVMKAMILPKLSVLDLYNLSHVSDDSKDWVKYYVRNKNYRLKIKADSEYEVSLLNSENQGLDVDFHHFFDDGNAEFQFGNMPVITRNEVTAPNQRKVSVISQRLDAQWDENEAMKSLIAHMSEVFTKDVCIHIGSREEQKGKIIMDIIKNLQLNVHCFDIQTACSLARIKEYGKCKRLRIGHGLLIENANITTGQMNLLFQQWMRNGTMDFFEVTSLPKRFNIDRVMRGHQYTTSTGNPVDSRNYSVTRADGVVATVTFTPECNDRRATRHGWLNYHTSAKFVLKCQTDQQQHSTCFGAY